MTISGPGKQPEQTGVCTATRTAMLPLQAAWHAMRTLAVATDSRLLYTVHWKNRLKLWGGENILSPWYIFIGGGGDGPPRPPRDRHHWLGVGRVRVRVGVKWGHRHIPYGWRLFNSNNFTTSAALAEVCAFSALDVLQRCLLQIHILLTHLLTYLLTYLIN